MSSYVHGVIITSSIDIIIPFSIFHYLLLLLGTTITNGVHQVDNIDHNRCLVIITTTTVVFF